MLARAKLQKGLQGRVACQWHIPRQDQHQRIIGQTRRCSLHRVAGAQLGLLANKLKIYCSRQPGQCGLNLIRAMAGNHHDFACIHRTRRLQRMPRQG